MPKAYWIAHVTVTDPEPMRSMQRAPRRRFANSAPRAGAGWRLRAVRGRRPSAQRGDRVSLDAGGARLLQVRHLPVRQGEQDRCRHRGNRHRRGRGVILPVQAGYGPWPLHPNAVGTIRRRRAVTCYPWGRLTPFGDRAAFSIVAICPLSRLGETAALARAAGAAAPSYARAFQVSSF